MTVPEIFSFNKRNSNALSPYSSRQRKYPLGLQRFAGISEASLDVYQLALHAPLPVLGTPSKATATLWPAWEGLQVFTQDFEKVGKTDDLDILKMFQR